MLHNRIITPNKQEYLSLKNVKYRKILENTRKLSRLICIFMPAVGRSYRFYSILDGKSSKQTM